MGPSPAFSSLRSWVGAHHGDVPGLVAWGTIARETGAGRCLLSCELAYFSFWIWGRSCGDGTVVAKWSWQGGGSVQGMGNKRWVGAMEGPHQLLLG